MTISARHPLYTAKADEWQLMRDTYAGEGAVKDRSTTYLPATKGHRLDGLLPGQPGYEDYMAYKARAVFHDFVADGVEAMIGMLHCKPPQIELPTQLEPLRDNATIHGESLSSLLQKINEQQLVAGRAGLLLDMPASPMNDPRPYIALYKAEDILNWDEGARTELALPSLNLVVLNESEHVRKDFFEWVWTEKYRVLVLGDPVANEAVGVYSTAVYEGSQAEFDPSRLTIPSLRGKALNRIPFVFVNSKDLVSDPDNPPLLGLARLSLAIYRGEADYRHTLFLQGQDTLVLIGDRDDDMNTRTGASSKISLPLYGDAKYIGIGSDGLSEQRQALENDKMAAANRSGQLIDTRSREKESGQALHTRAAAQTATLNQIALAGGAALESILKMTAEWMGADPGQVKVKPNLDFSSSPFTAKELVEMITAKTLGAPISQRSIHEMMQERGMTRLQFDEELAAIQSEEPLVDEPEEEDPYPVEKSRQPRGVSN